MKKLLATGLIVFATSSFADSPEVLNVDASQSGGSWRFDVTLKHADTGWEHYANGWGVFLEDGTELGYRVLAHPHVNEMPFTRSLSSVKTPNGTDTVIIRPRDLVHGEGAAFSVSLR